MKYKKELLISISCLFLAFLLSMSYTRNEEESLAARIAPGILRFHVIANSDSKTDQSLKLEVRTLLLDTIYEDIGADATKDKTCEYIRANEKRLEQTAETYMKEKGFSYRAHIEIASSYFPSKTYGDVTFPPGYYDAAKVTLGSGSGQNWWCVLYPPLCFVDATYAIVPEESKMTLKNILPEDDFAELMRVGHPDIKISFKILEILKNGL